MHDFAINRSLHHLHVLQNDSVNDGIPKDVCIVLLMTDSFSWTFTSSPVTTPVTRSRHEEY